MAKLTIAIAVIIGAIVVGANGRATRNKATYMSGQCSNDQDCKPGECCVLGPYRYSIPQCHPMLENGATCRPTDTRVNSTLLYPDGNQITLTNVHYILCPCTFGLGCDTDDNGTCRDLSQKRGFNHLLEEASTQDD